MAEPVRTFLKENDFSEKEVLIFATNAGWIGSTMEDMKKEIGQAAIKTLDVKYSVDGSERLTDEKEIEQFISC